jgi:hypothetical protein
LWIDLSWKVLSGNRTKVLLTARTIQWNVSLNDFRFLSWVMGSTNDRLAWFGRKIV